MAQPVKVFMVQTLNLSSTPLLSRGTRRESAPESYAWMARHMGEGADTNTSALIHTEKIKKERERSYFVVTGCLFVFSQPDLKIITQKLY